MASAIDSLTSSSPTSTSSTTTDRFGELTSEDFVKIMFTELQNQDPLKPNDSNTLLQQFSSLRSIEADLSLQQNLQDVVKQGQLSTAGGLIGKTIQGYTANFDPVEGVVKSVSQSDSGPVLNLQSGWSVPFKNIASILDGSSTTTTTGSTTGGTTGGSGTTGTTDGSGGTGTTDPPVVPSTLPPNSGIPSGGTGSTSNTGAN
ncbi:MAG TPA: flagellar hook capping FlgD N-terminal domain-containing protein [Phycisphaerales bacterium]|jgi:flagellar basal-body rod modification protein FlgD|nr:flagellar hook capping FlgD N-terminal domain-containing protein [Phycisphaerales bacterium]